MSRRLTNYRKLDNPASKRSTGTEGTKEKIARLDETYSQVVALQDDSAAHLLELGKRKKEVEAELLRSWAESEAALKGHVRFYDLGVNIETAGCQAKECKAQMKWMIEERERLQDIRPQKVQL